jgi:zeaxanthin glucosyltransferase
MKLGFICPNVPGHLNPLTTLARHLQARGHEVVFLYSSEAAGLPCVPVDEKDQVHESIPEISKMQGDKALQFAAQVMMGQSESILKSLPDVVTANGHLDSNSGSRRKNGQDSQ